jgi:hypothetical protein
MTVPAGTLGSTDMQRVAFQRMMLLGLTATVNALRLEKYHLNSFIYT